MDALHHSPGCWEIRARGLFGSYQLVPCEPSYWYAAAWPQIEAGIFFLDTSGQRVKRLGLQLSTVTTSSSSLDLADLEQKASNSQLLVRPVCETFVYVHLGMQLSG